MEPVTVTLTSPIKCMGQPVGVLIVAREARGRDMREIDGIGSKTATLILIRLLCQTGDGKQLTSDAVDELTWRDIAAIEQAMAPFVGLGPETGEPSAGTSP